MANMHRLVVRFEVRLDSSAGWEPENKSLFQAKEGAPYLLCNFP